MAALLFCHFTRRHLLLRQHLPLACRCIILRVLAPAFALFLTGYSPVCWYLTAPRLYLTHTRTNSPPAACAKPSHFYSLYHAPLPLYPRSRDGHGNRTDNLPQCFPVVRVYHPSPPAHFACVQSTWAACPTAPTPPISGSRLLHAPAFATSLHPLRLAPAGHGAVIACASCPAALLCPTTYSRRLPLPTCHLPGNFVLIPSVPNPARTWQQRGRQCHKHAQRTSGHGRRTC